MDHSEPDNKPVFKKEITLGNVISFLVVVGGAFGVWLHQDERITVVETAFAAHVQADAKADQESNEFRKMLQDQLNRIERKLK